MRYVLLEELSLNWKKSQLMQLLLLRKHIKSLKSKSKKKRQPKPNLLLQSLNHWRLLLQVIKLWQLQLLDTLQSRKALTSTKSLELAKMEELQRKILLDLWKEVQQLLQHHNNKEELNPLED